MSFVWCPKFRSKKEKIIGALQRMGDYFTTPERIKELFIDEMDVGQCKKVNCYYVKELVTNTPGTGDFQWFYPGFAKPRFSFEFKNPVYLPCPDGNCRDGLYADCGVFEELNLCITRGSSKSEEGNFYFLLNDSKDIHNFKKAMKKRLKGVWKK